MAHGVLCDPAKRRCPHQRPPFHARLRLRSRPHSVDLLTAFSGESLAFRLTTSLRPRSKQKRLKHSRGAGSTTRRVAGRSYAPRRSRHSRANASAGGAKVPAAAAPLAVPMLALALALALALVLLVPRGRQMQPLSEEED